MRRLTITLALVGAAAAVPATAQLLGERVEGRQRLCIYAPEAGNFLSDGRGRRTYQTGLGENCPVTFPSARSNFAAPPTARLRPESTSGESRSCVYEQNGSEWVLPRPQSGICPLYAGMIERRPQRR